MKSKTNLTMHDFYDFSSCGYMTTFAASADEFERLLSFNVPGMAGDFYYRLICGNYQGIKFPVVYRELESGASGKKMRDILDTRYHATHLISARFKTALEESGLTGWQCYPIKLYDRKGNIVDGYNGFSIIGRAGALGKYETPPTEAGYSPKSYGYYFDVDTWDGSDIFVLESSRCIVVTERFIEMLKKYKITACTYARLTDYGDVTKDKFIR